MYVTRFVHWTPVRTMNKLHLGWLNLVLAGLCVT